MIRICAKSEIIVEAILIFAFAIRKIVPLKTCTRLTIMLKITLHRDLSPFIDEITFALVLQKKSNLQTLYRESN